MGVGLVLGIICGTCSAVVLVVDCPIFSILFTIHCLSLTIC